MDTDRHDPVELGHFFEVNNKEYNKCLEPGMKCQKKAIRAHSVQNSRVFDLIATDNHVITPQARFFRTGPSIEFKSVGRNLASTFTGLCSQHDAALFGPLDNKPFDADDPEQLFLLAYRSVTRELHAVMHGALKLQGVFQSQVERGLLPKDQPTPSRIEATKQLIFAYRTHTYRATSFDQSLMSSDFGAIEHDILTFANQRPNLAVSSLFSVPEGRGGDKATRVVLNVLPVAPDRTLAVFSYTREDRKNARALLDRVLTGADDYQKYELSKLIIMRIENFFLSPRHFLTWSERKKNLIIQQFSKTIFADAKITDDPDLMLF